MADPYVGEIRTVGFNFAPQGWAMCSGQLVPIQQNTALFSLLGTYYGGDGRVTFALPNLNGAFAIGQGQGQGLAQRTIGEIGGVGSVALSQAEMPVHTHPANAVAAAGTSGVPTGRMWAEPRYGRAVRSAYSPGKDATLAIDAVGVNGGSNPHENMPPYLGVYFVIALAGIYPPRG